MVYSALELSVVAEGLSEDECLDSSASVTVDLAELD